MFVLFLIDGCSKKVLSSRQEIDITKNIANWFFFFNFLSTYDNLELRNLEMTRVILFWIDGYHQKVSINKKYF